MEFFYGERIIYFKNMVDLKDTDRGQKFTRLATFNPARIYPLLSMLYSCIHAAFKSVSALIGALTTAKGGSKGEEEKM